MQTVLMPCDSVLDSTKTSSPNCTAVLRGLLSEISQPPVHIVFIAFWKSKPLPQSSAIEVVLACARRSIHNEKQRRRPGLLLRQSSDEFSLRVFIDRLYLCLACNQTQ